MAKLIIESDINHHDILTKHKYVKSDEDSDKDFDVYNRKGGGTSHQVVIDKAHKAYNYYPPEYTGSYGFNKNNSWPSINKLDDHLSTMHKNDK